MINIHRILYPIDLDAEDFYSLIKALEIARLLRSAIHIIYVNDIQAGVLHPADREEAVALLVKKVVPEELLDNLEITYATAKGAVDEEIVGYCQTNAIDLIVVGHKHRNKIYSLFFDSPDVNIIDAVKIPVLIIPHD